MIIKTETSLDQFEAWSGAKETLEKVKECGLCEALESIIEELFPDGITDTELNDLLWFDSDWIYEQLCIDSEDGEIILEEDDERDVA